MTEQTSDWTPNIGDRVEFIVPGERTGPRGGTITSFPRARRHGGVWDVRVLWDGVKNPRLQMLETLRRKAPDAGTVGQA